MKTWSVKLFGIDFDIRQDDDGVFIIPEGIPGGSALKPAWEPIILCRKPLDGTIAQNATKWGVGGLNIDGCRVGIEDGDNIYAKNPHTVGTIGANGIYGAGKATEYNVPQGRFPANLCLSHSPECKCVGTKKVKGVVGGTAPVGGNYKLAENRTQQPYFNYADPDGTETVEAWECVEGCPIRLMDEQSGIMSPSFRSGDRASKKDGIVPWNKGRESGRSVAGVGFGDKGGASRFFYTAKASKRDRDEGCEGLPIKQSVGGGGGIGDYLEDVNSASGKYGSEKAPARNNHPTVKSTSLMRWLTRLVVPPNGLCLDPFMGSGSTGKACMYEGFNFIGIEQDAEYCKIAEARIRYAQNNAGKEPDKKKPTPRKPTTPKAAEQPAPEKPAPKPSAQVSIFEIDKS